MTIVATVITAEINDVIKTTAEMNDATVMTATRIVVAIVMTATIIVEMNALVTNHFATSATTSAVMYDAMTEDVMIDVVTTVAWDTAVVVTIVR